MTTLPQLIERFERREQLQNPDEIVPAHALSMTGAGTIETPAGQHFALTDWSRSQLSSMLGVRWDKWFSRASGDERAADVNRRLGRMGDTQFKLRTSNIHPDGVQADGTLDGIVTPSYTPIPDSKVVRLLASALALHDPDLKVIRSFSTDKSSSYVITVGKPLRRASVVGDITAGILVQNSGCGFCCLSIQAHVTRLICTNGMTAVDTATFKKRHRGLNLDVVAEGIFEGVRKLPGTISRTLDLLDRSTTIAVRDVRVEARRLLQEGHLPLRHLDPIMRAYDAEPLPTAFGVSSAATAHAKSVDPETRIALEAAAASYLAAGVS